ncbi:MAG: hypothetical protein IPK97_04275 [Ahniella sp.]|nr:hypothetical protein [Ahniella sp.]
MIDAGTSVEGFAWVERAAINGLATAQSKVGFSLLQGKGIPKEEERALSTENCWHCPILRPSPRQQKFDSDWR